jgi:septal ring factor EnvC (AmiA/AmiB activator)
MGEFDRWGVTKTVPEGSPKFVQEIAELKAEVERLNARLAEARDDINYWKDSLCKAQDRHSAQEGAYLKVIQVLSGRN